MTTKKKQTDTPKNSEPDTLYITDPEISFDVQETTAWSLAGADSGKKALATALAKAQAECQNVVMNKTNPHFRSRYADLAAVRDAIIPVFAKHGLSITQAPNIDPDIGFFLETRLMHEGGESIIWRFPLPSDVTKMQSVGSAISYARRYTLGSIAAVASEEDDDGNAATNTNGGGQPHALAPGRTGPTGPSTGGRGVSGGRNDPPGGIVL